MFVELRVHGVSGTPPVDMLDHPLVEQVAGDTDGRFFRPVDSAGRPLPAGDGHVLEGYHWGPLTSGSWRNALWLVLIPFGLVNAAYFMLPGGGGRAAREIARGALRVLAIVLTAVFVLGMAQASAGLLVWQWTTTADPSWWLLLAFAGVAVALLVIRFLGGPPKAVPDRTRWTGEAPTALAGGEFYTGDRDVTALRHLHLTAGFATLAVLAAAVADVGWLYWTGVVVLAWSVVHAALLGDPTAPRRNVRRLFATALPVVALCVSALALLAAVALLVFVADLPAAQRGVLPGTVDVGRWATVVGPVALGVLVVATAWLAVQTRDATVPKPFRRYLWGMAGPVVAALGMFLAVGFTAALDYGVLRLLRSPDKDMTLPLFYVRIAYAAGIAVVLGLAIAVVLAVRMLAARRRYARMVSRSGADGGQVGTVARAWWLARLKFGAQWLAVTLAAAGVVLTVAAVWEGAGDDTVCRSGGTVLSDCADRPGLDLVTVGTAALLLLGGFLVYLGRRAVGDSAVRRAACVVWDVVAFWPSAVHPFVPPPYSPKVIEDLRRRIAWHLGRCYELAPAGPCACARPDRPAEFLVLAGHSQGSLIAAAAVARLGADSRHRVALLTFGSQLQIAYARGFPAYVDHDFLCWLQNNVHRWVSLYRETDPIGGPVLSWARTDVPVFRSRRLGGDGLADDDVTTLGELGVRMCGEEWRLPDPALADGVSRPRLAMHRHSFYSRDPAWEHALARVREAN